MTPKRPRPNIRDVAALAGVSHMTVSRVINDHPSLRDDTRQRVRAAMEELDYRPNSDARALASRRTDRIGVIIDSPGQVGPANTMLGVEQAALVSGYRVSTVTVGTDGRTGARAALQHLSAQGVDGLCVIAPRASSLSMLRELDRGIPTLVVTPSPDDGHHAVAVDQAGGARLAMEHLLGLGHRRIAHLAGPGDWLDARARLDGYRAAMEAVGEPVEVLVGDWTADSGYALGAALDPATTAVFAANDQMALGLIHALADRGIDVPGDVSVVGFDDLADVAHYRPPLTTVRQDFSALGQRAIETLVAVMAGEARPRIATIPASLTVRDSTATPSR
ncbi:LacI family DNA-binding transcriptional regulator [Agrococcus jejuensis]|uniref:LacI family DNA-binding transcriptional regulator n=1 Tax=Agrococcus jejuensis TaxID=399736 RepID=UPI00119E3378|nr:LacI family DNA-binding transcriptional regulator [Agrococcus jejuensis]